MNEKTDSAGTAAELKEMERALEPFMGGCDRAFIRMAAQAAIGTTTALRKQLDEARRVQMTKADLRTVIELTRANAQMAAALREAVNLLKVLDQLGGLGHDKHGWIKKTLAEIIPASQETPASPSPGLRGCNGECDDCIARVCDDLPCMKFPSPGLREPNWLKDARWVREAVIAECAKLIEGLPTMMAISPKHVKATGPKECAAAIRALASRPVSEREDGQ